MDRSGYTSDTRHAEKVQEKREQYSYLGAAADPFTSIGDARLQHKTSNLDHDVMVDLKVMTFGVGGTLYKPAKHALCEVGVAPTEMKRLSGNLKKIHLHSIQ